MRLKDRTVILKNGEISPFFYFIRIFGAETVFSVFSAIFDKSLDCFFDSLSCFSATSYLVAVRPPPPILARELSLYWDLDFDFEPFSVSFISGVASAAAYFLLRISALESLRKVCCAHGILRMSLV